METVVDDEKRDETKEGEGARTDHILLRILNRVNGIPTRIDDLLKKVSEHD